MEPKRSHQWLSDSSGSELVSNKTRAVECNDARGVPQMNLLAWGNSQLPEHIRNRLFGCENSLTTNLIEGRKDLEEQYVSSFGLSHAVHDSSSSCYNLGGIRKIKVNEVNDFNKSMPETMTQFYCEGIPRSLDSDSSYNKTQNNIVSLSQTGSSSDKSFGFVGPVFGKEGAGLSPMMSGVYDKGDNFVSMGQSLQKMDSNIFSMNPYNNNNNNNNRGQESFMSILTSYGKAAENLFSSEDGNVLSTTTTTTSPFKAGSDMTFSLPNQNRVDHINHQGGSNIISFGSFQNENTLISSGSILNGYESIGNIGESLKDQIQKETEQNMSRRFNAAPIVHTGVSDTLPRSKESKITKKVSANTFPSNVKSLLSTGMFDGVPVKYYSWSREKNLQGVIKGTGYLCSCSECKMTKVLNAYEFERHANCKTKHPNNHIYFENGKTIYAVVQELKNTPQEMLFDVIQSITGSEINHKNFNTWKASFQAASRELQRIYGTDGVPLAS